MFKNKELKKIFISLILVSIFCIHQATAAIPNMCENSKVCPNASGSGWIVNNFSIAYGNQVSFSGIMNASIGITQQTCIGVTLKNHSMCVAMPVGCKVGAVMVAPVLANISCDTAADAALLHYYVVGIVGNACTQPTSTTWLCKVG